MDTAKTSARHNEYEMSAGVLGSNISDGRELRTDTAVSNPSMYDDRKGMRGKTFGSTAELKHTSYDSNDLELAGREEPLVVKYEEVALKALHVDDDPTLNPWTFRMFFLGE